MRLEPNMSNSQVRSETAMDTSPAKTVDLQLEVVVIPVTDVERAKRFYADLGWRLDADFAVDDVFRGVQFTPPGSPCSIHFGKSARAAKPSSPSELYLVVSDIKAARAALIHRDIEVGEVFHRAGPGQPAVNGLHPDRRSYSSFASFKDPDGNAWLLQEITTRFPGRVNTDETKFTSSLELAKSLRRAEIAHGEHEKKLGKRDEDWPTWYAEYMVREQSGDSLPP
jgi:catechol 2,3-dioxygenase-like lactoylglutathione lyase family enzyme